MTEKQLGYGPVFVTGGAFKGHVMYYDDDQTDRTAICYAGHPVNFTSCYDVRVRFLRVPSIEDLLSRRDAIWREMVDIALHRQWNIDPRDIHDLWAEKDIIDDALFERRLIGEMAQIPSEKSIFLCHSSSDKGIVRMVNDDLRRMGATTWLDENNIKVGESIVGKISEGLKSSQFLLLFLSEDSIKSKWTTREWQSFLSRQLSGNNVTILPVLIEKCDIPPILSDIKYANFSDSYYSGLQELATALL